MRCCSWGARGWLTEQIDPFYRLVERNRKSIMKAVVLKAYMAARTISRLRTCPMPDLRKGDVRIKVQGPSRSIRSTYQILRKGLPRGPGSVIIEDPGKGPVGRRRCQPHERRERRPRWETRLSSYICKPCEQAGSYAQYVSVPAELVREETCFFAPMNKRQPCR